MNALIIGGAGFVGKYLIRELAIDKENKVYATKLFSETICDDGCIVYDLDILNRSAMETLLCEIKPDIIFHLAAQSSVALSWENPTLTVDVNIKGTINLLDSVRMLDYKPRILLIGSGEEYGIVTTDDMPIKETHPVNPQNIYAVTKATQNQIGKLYAKSYNLDILSVRAFNHIGPGQSSQFVVSDFCKQVAEIENGLREPVLAVGNLSAKRDFTDVRDIVRAYVLLAEKGSVGETYNVGSGKAISISDILDKLLEISSAKIEVKADKNKFRPIDVPIVFADIEKLKNCTNWSPIHSINNTISDVLDYWRQLLLKSI